MNWFARHLNWSLVLGLFYIPLNIGATVGFIISIFIIIIGLVNYGFGSELLQYLAGIEETLGEMTRMVLGILILLLDLGGIIWVTLWYLGKKGRSGWFVLLLLLRLSPYISQHSYSFYLPHLLRTLDPSLAP